ncbi:MAG: YgjP-like metallopeptidase domain-containing protein [Sporomusaceae bacterium]|nr:YgjP-like metallopeptidase domain-containing protein [Sporomusaceae bacterium]
MQRFLQLGWDYSLQIVAKGDKMKLRFFHHHTLLHQVAKLPDGETVLATWSKNKTLSRMQKRVERYLICLNQKELHNRRPLSLARRRRWPCAMPPDPVVEYIIFYELCRTIYEQAQPDFYRLLAAILPDYKRYQALFQDYLLARTS